MSEELFDCTLDFNHTHTYTLTQRNRWIWHGKAYPISQIYLDTFRKVIDQLESVGLLKIMQGSERGSPSQNGPKQNVSV